MRRDLAGEHRVLVAHPLLDERVARRGSTSGTPPAASIASGTAHERAHVVDHLRARLLRQDRLREQRGREVARDELARVVDEEAAVGVAVVGDAEVGALLASSRGSMNSRFSGSSGFGSWFGNEPSGSK